jgi:hypothetical protein
MMKRKGVDLEAITDDDSAGAGSTADALDESNDGVDEGV